MFSRLQRDIENIIDSVVELTYYMRGAIGYEEMLNRTHGERDRINVFIEKLIEMKKKDPNMQL